MQCAGCAEIIKENLEKLKSITSVSVDFNSKSLTISGNPNQENIENVIASLGYALTK